MAELLLRLLLAAACCIGPATCASWSWAPMSAMPAMPAPMFLSYARPRRAPVGPARPPQPPAGVQGMPLYPSRSLSFSGYFSGAGVPQPGDPYALSWGPALRRSQEESAAADDMPAAPESPSLPPQEQPAQPAAPAGVGVDASPGEPDDSGDRDEKGIDTRAEHGPGRKQPRPSYPAPAPPRAPASPSEAPGGHEDHGGHGGPGMSNSDDNNGGDDRGGYGTINAWFPFMFSGGWPMMGAGSSGRGYGAPSSSSGGPGPSSGPSASPGLGSYGGHNSNSADRHAAAPGAGGGYYPVAIANSFSTGRNAVASSTATAYGGSPPANRAAK